MKAGVTAMTIATEKMEAASNDGQEEATRGGRRGKQAKTGRAAASEKADSLVTCTPRFYCIISADDRSRLIPGLKNACAVVECCTFR